MGPTPSPASTASDRALQLRHLASWVISPGFQQRQFVLGFSLRFLIGYRGRSGAFLAPVHIEFREVDFRFAFLGSVVNIRKRYGC